MSSPSRDFWKALDIMFRAHQGSYDKGGAPYQLHPIAVASRLQTEEEQILALLHDVIEDSAIRLEHLDFSPSVMEGLDAITRREGESYWDYIRRVRKNPLAKRVKIADIKHNLDEDRVHNLGKSHIARYNRALSLLSGPRKVWIQ